MSQMNIHALLEKRTKNIIESGGETGIIDKDMDKGGQVRVLISLYIRQNNLFENTNRLSLKSTMR